MAIVLLIVFVVFILVQLSYWFFFSVNFLAISRKKVASNTHSLPVSIVICYKNEAENLSRLLLLVLEQLKAKDELILVDDFSSDHSDKIISEIVKEDSRCIKIKATSDMPGKKQALIDGVATASNQYILVTDADCMVPPNWRILMGKAIDHSTHFVLGYAPFHKKTGFLNDFQRYECLLTASQYFSYAHAGLPYMGVGRNMLFQKSIFSPAIYKNDLASGDDDLLVSAKATESNTALILDPETFVYSDAKTTLTSYIRQKLRHITTSSAYKLNIKLLLGLFSLSQIGTYTIFILLLLTKLWIYALVLFILRLSLISLAVKSIGQILKENDLYLKTILLDAFLTLYYLILMLIFPFKSTSSWN